MGMVCLLGPESRNTLLRCSSRVFVGVGGGRGVGPFGD